MPWRQANPDEPPCQRSRLQPPKRPKAPFCYAAQVIEKRSLGRSGVTVSRLGLGAGPLGDAQLSEAEVDHLLARALDFGVCLVDTAPSYGNSETRIGRVAALRRKDLVLSTKVGYAVPGVPDWTGPCITAGISLALQRLRTDWLDIVHLHSCPLEVLQRGEVIEALLRAKQAGSLRAAAYSGDGEALAWAVHSGAFDSIQASLSVCDRANATIIEAAVAKGIGVLAKRALANAPWRFVERPSGRDEETYWDRWRALGLESQDPAGDCLAWTLAQPVDAALVGTKSVARLDEAISAAQRPRRPGWADDAHYAAVGAGWPAKI